MKTSVQTRLSTRLSATALIKLRHSKAFSVAILMGFSLVLPAASAPPAKSVLPKGDWNGPDRSPIPGPGPSANQSLSDYFKSLKTGPRSPKLANILVLGGGDGFRHDSISTAMAAIQRWGMETGAWDAEIRTDFKLINAGGGEPMNAGFQPTGLADFDAVVVVSAEGEWPLDEKQKTAFLDFVRAQGKGLVVIHAGLAANRNWPEYIDMIGGEQTGHPFNTLQRVVRPFPIVREDGSFPAVAALPIRFVKQDELYVVRNWSRNDVNVLLRLDESRLDFSGIEDQVPPSRDIPIAWSKVYGNGRVFASSIGHTRESFSDPDIEMMYREAIKWVLGLTDGGIGPHPHPDVELRRQAK
jgi:uncharacterized protein